MSAVDYLELTAIIAGAAFGVLGTMTETKDKKKQLTTWGWVAVAGVVVTNGFSLVTTSLKQQQSTQDEINRLKIEKSELPIRTSLISVNFIYRILLLGSVIIWLQVT